MKFAPTNFGATIGLHGVGEMRERVHAINEFFESCRTGDKYDRAAITHKMDCNYIFPVTR